MDLEEEFVRWMDDNESELFQILKEEDARFRAMHPGIDPVEVRINATAMANRRYVARALGAVLPAYLENRGQTDQR